MVRSLIAVFGVVVMLGGVASAQENLPPHPTLPECQRDDPTLILPDLFPEVPGNARTFYQDNDRKMQFTTSVGNIGPGPLILEGVTVSNSDGVFTAAYQRIDRMDGSQCAHSAGLFIYHPEHKHWHFDRFVGYELRVDDPYTGELVAGGEKMSFCLLDIQTVRGFNALQYQRQVLTQTCNSAEGIVGISVGWEDVYERFLPGQSIDLDPDRNHQVPTGTYVLVNIANPDGKIWEANLDNNTSFASVRVSLAPPNLGNRPPPTPTPGPAKNPQLPHIRVRPTRPPRATRAPRATRPPRPGAPTATPTRTSPPAPPATPTRTRPVDQAPTPTATPMESTSGPHQPHSPSGGAARATRPPRPTRAPRPRPGDVGPTATPFGLLPVAGCENACSYNVSQIRFTWYDRIGLTFQGFIARGGAGCPPLHPDPGVPGMMLMTNWLNQPQQDLGLDHDASFVLGEKGEGATSDGGEITVSTKSSGYAFTYKADLPPPAHMSDGFAGTPVVFDSCFTLGNEAVRMRLVCQAHTQGLLCHEG
jgi:Lysyl oxidase